MINIDSPLVRSGIAAYSRSSTFSRRLKGMTSLRVYLVRHGETDANRQSIVQGQLDTELNELGQKQAVSVAERLRSVPFDLSFSSDLGRAVKTAEAIHSYHQDVDLVKQKELRERFMGDLQGKQAAAGNRCADDNVEPLNAFIKRITKWWDACLLKHLTSLPPKSSGLPFEILIVSHGGVIGTLVRSLIRQQRLSCAKGVYVSACLNTSVSVIEVGKDGRGVITMFGDVSHLGGIPELENVDELGN